MSDERRSPDICEWFFFSLINLPLSFSLSTSVATSRLKSQYESELREMERNERQTRDKYTEARTKLAECEANAQNLQATVKQFEIQLTHAQRVSDSFGKHAPCNPNAAATSFIRFPLFCFFLTPSLSRPLSVCCRCSIICPWKRSTSKRMPEKMCNTSSTQCEKNGTTKSIKYTSACRAPSRKRTRPLMCCEKRIIH